MNYARLQIRSLIIVVPLIFCTCHGNKNDFSVKYKYTGIAVENAQNLGDFPYPTTQDSIAEVAYATRVNLFTEIIAKGSAHADYDHPIENLNRLDSINVKSNADFGLGFPIGSSLNENFICFNGSYFTSSSLDVLSLPSTSNKDYTENSVPNKFDLLLMSPPSLPSTHKFTIQLFLMDGTILIDSTTQIKLY